MWFNIHGENIMYIERLNNIAKSKSKNIKLKKVSEYNSAKTGTVAAIFHDDALNIRTKVVKLGENNKLRTRLGADEFVLHNMKNTPNIRTLSLYDAEGKELCQSSTFSDLYIKELRHQHKNFAEFRRLFKKILK